MPKITDLPVAGALDGSEEVPLHQSADTVKATVAVLRDFVLAALGFDAKASVRAATTANITLSGAQTIDGVSVIAGDRVLVKAQTSGAENGIYIAAAGAWSRSSDADTSAEVTSGLYVVVEEGTANGGKLFILTTADPITLGTMALTFTALSGGSSVPLTTKGDILTYDTALARLPVGSDGEVLTADSAQSVGVKWAAASGSASTTLDRGVALDVLNLPTFL